MLAGFTAAAQKQTAKWKVGTDIGYNDNIFKGPKSFYDKKAEQYLDMDTVLLKDMFVENKSSLELTSEKFKKYKFALGFDAWKRNYFQNPLVNSSDVSFKLSGERFLTKKWGISGRMNTTYSNKLGITILGDAIVRSMEYWYNEGAAGWFYRWDKRKRLDLEIGAFNKNFFSDTTTSPLHHTMSTFKAIYTFEPKKKRVWQFSGSMSERKYSNYWASDSMGVEDSLNGNRHFLYFNAGLSYNRRYTKKLSLIPELKVSHRKDLFKDFFTNTAIGGGLKARYFMKKFYFSTSVNYRTVYYNVKIAPTYNDEPQLLLYQFLKWKMKAKMKIGKQLEVEALASFNHRGSNGELHSWITRRPYNVWQYNLGLRYKILNKKVKDGSLFEIKPKRRTKGKRLRSGNPTI